MAASNRAYLTILAWPADFDGARREEVCSRVLGADALKAREWSQHPTPAMIKREDLAYATRLVSDLATAGVIAMAVPVSSIREGMNPQLVRGLEREGEGASYALDLGRAGKAFFEPRNLACLVRARVRDVGPHFEGDFGVQALHQLQGTLSAEDWSQGHTGRRAVQVFDVLDILTTTSAHWRLIGGRCTIAGVADGEGVTAREVLDELAERLVSDAGRLTVYSHFDQARFMADFVPDFGVSGDWRSLAGFDVYAAWLRHLELARRAEQSSPS